MASFMDHDEIPAYGEGKGYSFSGKRITRGLYRSKDGTVISADINAASNILRKAIPDAFDGIEDLSFLQEVRTVGFRDLHPLSRES